MLSIFKMASKVVKNVNSYKVEFLPNPDWMNLVLAEFFLNPDWMNLVLADLFHHIRRVFLVLDEFRVLLARFKLYQADKLMRFSSNIMKLINK